MPALVQGPRQFFLMIVEKCSVGYDDQRYSQPQNVDDSARAFVRHPQTSDDVQPRSVRPQTDQHGR